MPITSSGKIGFGGSQYFGASGTFEVPSGVTKLRVRLLGAGGGGGTGYSPYTTGAQGSSGGCGGYAEKLIDVESGQIVSVTVGAGGGVATAGGTSSFGAYVSATGGGGGTSASYPANAKDTAIGGNGVNGDINIKGSNAADSVKYSPLMLGRGANNSTGINVAGGAGDGLGSNGGGAFGRTGAGVGGAGKAGFVLVEW